MGEVHSRTGNALAPARVRDVGAARDGAHHPERWLRWLTQRQVSLSVNRYKFAELVTNELRQPEMTAPGKWAVSDVWPRRSSRQSWAAYWIGEAVRDVQCHHRVPSHELTSGLESLIAGGYWGDLLATVGLTLQRYDASSERESLIRELGGLAKPKAPFLRVVSEAGSHGSTIRLWDYDKVIAETAYCFPITDTSSINAAFQEFRRRGRDVALAARFDAARHYVESGREALALESFGDAIVGEINRIRGADIPNLDSLSDIEWDNYINEQIYAEYGADVGEPPT